MTTSVFNLLVSCGKRDGRKVYVHVLDEVCGQQGDVFHAVPADHVHSWVRTRSRRRTWDAVCGARVAPVLVEDVEVRATVAWPPDVAGLRAFGWSRCRDCHRLTGRKRPRVALRRREEVAA